MIGPAAIGSLRAFLVREVLRSHVLGEQDGDVGRTEARVLQRVNGLVDGERGGIDAKDRGVLACHYEPAFFDVDLPLFGAIEI
jgi:hypothetical protein